MVSTVIAQRAYLTYSFELDEGSAKEALNEIGPCPHECDVIWRTRAPA